MVKEKLGCGRLALRGRGWMADAATYRGLNDEEDGWVEGRFVG